MIYLWDNDDFIKHILIVDVLNDGFYNVIINKSPYLTKINLSGFLENNRIFKILNPNLHRMLREMNDFAQVHPHKES